MGRISLGTFVLEFDESDYDIDSSFQHILENETDLWFEENEGCLYFTAKHSPRGMIYELHGPSNYVFGDIEVEDDTCFCLKDLKSDVFCDWVDAMKDDFDIEFARKRRKGE